MIPEGVGVPVPRVADACKQVLPGELGAGRQVAVTVVRRAVDVPGRTTRVAPHVGERLCYAGAACAGSARTSCAGAVCACDGAGVFAAIASSFGTDFGVDDWWIEGWCGWNTMLLVLLFLLLQQSVLFVFIY